MTITTIVPIFANPTYRIQDCGLTTLFRTKIFSANPFGEIFADPSLSGGRTTEITIKNRGIHSSFKVMLGIKLDRP